jgi:hypothetical protein
MEQRSEYLGYRSILLYRTISTYLVALAVEHTMSYERQFKNTSDYDYPAHLFFSLARIQVIIVVILVRLELLPSIAARAAKLSAHLLSASSVNLGPDPTIISLYTDSLNSG